MEQIFNGIPQNDSPLARLHRGALSILCVDLGTGIQEKSAGGRAGVGRRAVQGCLASKKDSRHRGIFETWGEMPVFGVFFGVK